MHRQALRRKCQCNLRCRLNHRCWSSNSHSRNVQSFSRLRSSPRLADSVCRQLCPFHPRLQSRCAGPSGGVSSCRRWTLQLSGCLPLRRNRCGQTLWQNLLRPAFLECKPRRHKIQCGVKASNGAMLPCIQRGPSRLDRPSVATSSTNVLMKLMHGPFLSPMDLLRLTSLPSATSRSTTKHLCRLCRLLHRSVSSDPRHLPVCLLAVAVVATRLLEAAVVASLSAMAAAVVDLTASSTPSAS